MNRKKKKVARLNLIPILDAIFIFIFFLLMSAQFLDIYEIGTDAPISASIDEDSKKKPLNLTIEINKNSIILKTGLNGDIKKQLKHDQLEDLNIFLSDLKGEHPEENSAIIKPNASVDYELIVKVIDNIKEKRGIRKEQAQTQNKLFSNIIFETI